MAELFGIAITGWARVIERAARDAELSRGRELPRAGSWSATLVAMLLAPLSRWRRRGRYRRAQREVEALYDEYATHGRLLGRLPTEVDVVQRVVRIYQREKAWKSSRESHSIPTTAEPILRMEPILEMNEVKPPSRQTGTLPREGNREGDTHASQTGRRRAA
jgi:hypothetical protein